MPSTPSPSTGSASPRAWFWPEDQPLPEGVVYATSLEADDPALYETLLIATDREFRETHPAHWANAVIYRPKSVGLCLASAQVSEDPCVVRQGRVEMRMRVTGTAGEAEGGRSAKAGRSAHSTGPW